MKKKNKILKNNIYMLKELFIATPELLIISSILSILKGIIAVLGSLWILYYIVDCIEMNKDIYYIAKTLFLYFLFVTGYCCLNMWFANYRRPILTFRAKEKLACNLIQKTRFLGLEQYENAETFDKFQLAKNCTDRTAFQVLSNYLIVLQNIISLVCGIVSVIFIDPYLVFFVFLAFPAIILGKKYGKENGIKSREMVRTTRIKSDMLKTFFSKQHAKIIRTSNVSAVLSNYYEKNALEQERIVDNHAKKLFFFFFLNYFLTVDFICIIAYLYAIIKVTVFGDVSLAMFSTLTTATMMIVSRTRKVLNCYEKATRHSVDIENLFSFYQLQPTVQLGEMNCDSFEMLEFKNVSFAYKDILILKNVNLKIKKGDKVAIVGHNGAGKTTLIKLLLGLYRVNEGAIYLNGHSILNYSRNALIKIFGVMFQDYHLFNFSIKENVAMESGVNVNDDRILSSLQQANLTYGSSEICLDYGRNFSKNGIVPSGGQSQKLAFSRLLYSNKDVWVMDEPSAALDPIAEEELYHEIMKSSNERTIIFISHRLSSVKLVDKIIFMKDGKFIETGTHDELIKNNGEYAKLYFQQARLYNDTKEIVNEKKS